MKKRTRQAGFTLAFLDVLSNAMAAVLILTIIRLQPGPPGEALTGFHFIRILRLDSSGDKPIGVEVKIANKSYTHEIWERASGPIRIKVAQDVVTVFFLSSSKPSDIQTYCYIVDPDWKREGECLLIDVNLPDIVFRKNVWLFRENGYRIQILEPGGLISEELKKYSCPNSLPARG
jgi:hypothetical protein